MKNFINLNPLSMSWRKKDQVKHKHGEAYAKGTVNLRVLSRITTILLLLTLGVGQMWGKRLELRDER